MISVRQVVVSATMAIIGFASAGCVYVGANLDVKDLADKPASIPGIGVPKSETPQLRVLMVHGMGGDRCPGYSVSRHRYSDEMNEEPGMINKVGEELGLCLISNPLDQLPPENRCKEEDISTYPPTITLTKFDYAKTEQGQACAGATVLRMYEVYYSGYGEAEEQRLEMNDRRVLGDGLKINASVKNRLMITGFGDAVMYLGQFGDKILGAVAGTICDMVIDPIHLSGTTSLKQGESSLECPGDLGTRRMVDSRAFILAHSLGSSIVIETLRRMAKDKDEAKQRAADRFVGQLETAYLMANQDGLLGLFDYQRKRSIQATGLMSMIAYDGTVVAFSGRNDLLSHALPPRACEEKDRCLNAALNVARWRIPFLLANPIQAHAGYESDPKVVECIAIGCKP